MYKHLDFEFVKLELKRYVLDSKGFILGKTALCYDKVIFPVDLLCDMPEEFIQQITIRKNGNTKRRGREVVVILKEEITNLFNWLSEDNDKHHQFKNLKNSIIGLIETYNKLTKSDFYLLEFESKVKLATGDIEPTTNNIGQYISLIKTRSIENTIMNKTKYFALAEIFDFWYQHKDTVHLTMPTNLDNSGTTVTTIVEKLYGRIHMFGALSAYALNDSRAIVVGTGLGNVIVYNHIDPTGNSDNVMFIYAQDKITEFELFGTGNEIDTNDLIKVLGNPNHHEIPSNIEHRLTKIVKLVHRYTDPHPQEYIRGQRESMGDVERNARMLKLAQDFKELAKNQYQLSLQLRDVSNDLADSWLKSTERDFDLRPSNLRRSFLEDTAGDRERDGRSGRSGFSRGRT